MNKTCCGQIERYSMPLLTLFAAEPAGPVDTRAMFYFGLFVLATGLVSLIYPRFFWNIGIGRKARIPPPPMYLTMLRIGGILACVLGLVMVFKA